MSFFFLFWIVWVSPQYQMTYTIWTGVPCRVWPRLDASIHSITNCTSFHQRTCPCQRYHYTSLTSWEKGDLFWPLLLSMSSQYFSHWLWICQRATDSINSSKSLATLNRLDQLVSKLLVGLIWRQVQSIETCVSPRVVCWAAPLLNCEELRSIGTI